MKVRTLRRHDNTYGDKYEKHPGKIYDHPSPRTLIDGGYLEAVDGPNDSGDRGAEGSGAGAQRASKGNRSKHVDTGATEGGTADR